MKKKKSSIKFKILAIPLISIFISITVITINCIVITEKSLISQMETDGMNLGKQIQSQIEINNKSMESINQSISDKIRTTGSFILNNSDKVNNEYLTNLAKQFEIDEINYTDTSGKIIYSSLPTSIGSAFDSNHICYPVLKGDKDFFVEDIRKSKETNDYYKYGYVSKTGVGMVQIGLIANKVQSLSKEIETQTLVEKLTEDKSIVYAVFIDTNLVQVANSEVSKIGEKVNDIGSKTSAVDGKPYSSIYVHDGIEVYDVLIPVHGEDKLLGAIDIGISMKTVKDTINNVLIIIIAISLIIFIISAFILLKVSKGITNPLNKLVFAAGKIAQGDLRHNVEINSTDEIGILYDSFDTMTKYLKDTMKTIKDSSSEVRDMSSSLSSNSKQMTITTSDVTSSIQGVSQGTLEQASDLVDISNNILKLSDELDNIYDKVNGVKDSSSLTEEKAIVGKQQIDILLKSIEEVKISFDEQAIKINNLNASVSKVGNITNVINGISEQTNLLALNAAIEAARAGEVGKGFAVVSEEVRKLAEQSKESTGQIQRLVESISSETQSVLDNSNSVTNLVDKQSSTVKSTRDAFNDMLNSLSNIGPYVEETKKSLQTTMESKNSIVETMDNITAVSQETSASAEEIAASSEEMLANSEEVSDFAIKLEEISQNLNDEINKFEI
ncbi:methyl-accepting chemotaxis protein McpB [Clostridium puniceum]|uniref:Methyl-accepting chemotaxis protein McpB n=1 Tax=Clostridium puniceum TaxID=29367 RepID=A0A1S8T6Z3_9CLOT|nr:methyl-accepting chemotaxis protein [Clostridium puniceum]OOM73399.1 methyl-accepting chemotaxis protein McpB [Clostridium puniceum]